MFSERLQRSCLRAAMALTTLILAACATTSVSTPAGSLAASPAAGASASVSAAAAAVLHNDYGAGANWLCLPGRADACVTDLASTVLPVAGTPQREAWAGDPKAPVDCFYVYPTVSNDPTPNSDMNAGPEERRAVQHQFARFGSVCRLFAPVYRQVTLAGLRSAMQGPASGIDPKMAYGDVVDAWNHYLKNDNQGRGVILIGHSQGARMLSELVKYEIEGKPVQKQLVAAYLIGFNVGVAKGSDTGGQFRQIPLCRAEGQTGCVVAYSTFREKSPPPANSRFGRLNGEMVAACTNPAALAGGRGMLHAYLPTRINLLGGPAAATVWGGATQQIATPFVSAPAFATAECIQRDGASYLAVSATPDYLAQGIDIPGDLVVNGKVLDDWGLHLVDVDLAIGNLIALARRQAQIYRGRAR